LLFLSQEIKGLEKFDDEDSLTIEASIFLGGRLSEILIGFKDEIKVKNRLLRHFNKVLRVIKTY